MYEEWEVIHNMSSFMKTNDDDDDTDTVRLEDKLLEVLEIENEKIADSILSSPMTGALKCFKAIPIDKIIKNTPTPVVLNIVCYIVKNNIVLDWKVSLALSGISVCVFMSKYSWLYKYYSVLRKLQSLYKK